MSNKMINFAVKSTRLAQKTQVSKMLTRNMSEVPPSKNLNEGIRKKMISFQSETGTPVFIKGGVLDSILYKFTMGCCVFAVGWIGVSMYQMAQPTKK